MSDTICNERNSKAICNLTDKFLQTEKIGVPDIKTNEYFSSFADDSLKIVESFDHDKESSNNTTCESSSDKQSPKTKKSVSFDTSDEKVQKFISGEPIVDQKNPFRNGYINGKDKKTPPPVPTKRSTLSVRKTVTQQLREREREKEREREREQLKNEENTRKKNAKVLANGGADEFITTEEVLKQSKYVKTYIKNPDPYFVYDPTVLARIKFEELQSEIAGKIPKKKQPLSLQQHEKDPKLNRLSKKQEAIKPKTPTFKKCSKPNYPELANIKIKTGTESDGDFFNPAEVTKNAKKFDERVKKLQISSDDDLDEIDGPLTKSESSDELTNNSTVQTEYKAKPNTIDESDALTDSMTSNSEEPAKVQAGTFTNTISSEEFQAYLERKGLTLMPKREMANGKGHNPPIPKQRTSIANNTANTFQTPTEQRPKVEDNPLTIMRNNNAKKLSVLQRLSNSIFAARRKTTPKSAMPTPRSIYSEPAEDYKRHDTPTEMRRILLKRQGYQPRARSPTTNSSLKRNNDENLRAARGQVPKSPASDASNVKDWQRAKPQESSKRLTGRINRSERQPLVDNTATPFQRTMERQSLIPRRVSPESNLRVFSRTASMDRNQIKAMSQKPRLDESRQRQSAASYVNSAERINLSQTMPNASSTPVRKSLGPQVQIQSPRASYPANNQNEWEKLRAIKEVTDRQLYHKVLQQQQQQSEENIYEHLPTNQILQTQVTSMPNFVRGSLQRNTFSGVSGRHRQVMILDGTPIIAAPAPAPMQAVQQLPPRCQSVMDDMITPTHVVHNVRRGYESENETPIVLRRKESSTGSRRIGGLMTREEILEKVKEFCRKSINRTPMQATKMQPIYERQTNNTADISPVSYASVETHKRPVSQLSAVPQLPQRVQSLTQQQQLQQVQQQQHYVGELNGVASSPIYAHVNKRHSLLSNDSEQYLSNQQLPKQQPQPQRPTEYILVETGEQVPVAKFIDYHNNGALYVQPQFIRTGPHGYVRIDDFVQSQQRLQHGRSTPLILDRANQQASQIYWTPQHQRLQQQQQQQLNQQQHPHMLTLPMSPTYTTEQKMYPVPAPRINLPSRLVTLHDPQRSINIANVQQKYATAVPAPRNIQYRQQNTQYPLDKAASNMNADSLAKSSTGEAKATDELLQSSTSSNAFNTWTILPSERIEILESQIPNRPTPADAEETENSESQANDRCKPLEDPQADEISDGISIISDCESTERISPHPFLREHLSELSFKFDTGDELPASLLRETARETAMDTTDYEIEHLRQRRRPQADPELERVGVVPAASNVELEQSKAIASHNFLPHIVQNGLTALFYVVATLAVLAFIGKLRYPEWQVLSNAKPIAEFDQRLNDLELQNNLMRAEIDIISKQLNFLNSKAGGQPVQDASQRNGRKSKTFKAWSGNGNAVDPVDITKSDLKRPYKCPDGKFVEIAAMCLENIPHAESLVDEIGNVVHDVLQQSQTFQNFEKFTEKLSSLGGANENGNAAKENSPGSPDNIKVEQAQHGNFKPNAENNGANENMKAKYHTDEANKQHYNRKPEYAKNEHAEHYNRKKEKSRLNHKEQEHSKERQSHKQEQHNRYKDHSKERSADRSKERSADHLNQPYAHNSKKRYDADSKQSNERLAGPYKKRREDHSKERKYDKSGEYKMHDKRQRSDGGDWHEKMMQNREQVRNQKEEQRNPNWYIERGVGRQHRRSDEQRH